MTSAGPQLTANAWLRFDSIRRALRRSQPKTVLEIGAGRGALGSWLARRYDYTGVEPDPTSRAVAAARLEEVGRGRMVDDLEQLDGEQYDFACAFEVLEHMEDDVKALEQWRELVRPGGSLVLSVPAHPRLYGPWDELAGHYRRYRRAELEERLERAGFDVVELRSQGAGLGYALELLRHAVARRARRSGTFEDRTSASGRRLQPKSTLSTTALALIAAPFRLVQLPFAHTDIGTGYVVAARRSR